MMDDNKSRVVMRCQITASALMNGETIMIVFDGCYTIDKADQHVAVSHKEDASSNWAACCHQALKGTRQAVACSLHNA